MTTRDFALEIEPGATPERLFEIEKVLHRFAEDQLCRVAQMIEADYFEKRIASPLQAAQICRDEGAQHLNQT